MIRRKIHRNLAIDVFAVAVAASLVYTFLVAFGRLATSSSSLYILGKSHVMPEHVRALGDVIGNVQVIGFRYALLAMIVVAIVVFPLWRLARSADGWASIVFAIAGLAGVIGSMELVGSVVGDGSSIGGVTIEGDIGLAIGVVVGPILAAAFVLSDGWKTRRGRATP